MAPELHKIGFERGWGDTVGSTLDTMHLLGELLQVGRTPSQPQALAAPARSPVQPCAGGCALQDFALQDFE